MVKYTVGVCLAVFLLFSAVRAQKADVTISLNEALLDALLDTYFTNFDPPEVALAEGKTAACSQSVKIIRETGGVRTSVRFRDGKVYAPLAFSGSYAAPFIGCVEFAGWAETNIDLEFDQNGQRLIGRMRVLNVNLNGSGGVGGTVIARMLQNSVDKKLNPIEILRLDQLSFAVPVQNSSIRLKAVSVRPEIVNGALNATITYQFLKS